MRAWSRAEPGDFRRLPLEAHALLEGVPIHDVWRLELPGGGPGRGIEDVRALMSTDGLQRVSSAVRLLFGLRWKLGSLFGWDRPSPKADAALLLHRLPDDLRARSTVPPGTKDGPFQVLYALERETAAEIRNATVHAFSVLALEPSDSGYRLFWAIYVAPVGRLTPLYMACIDPFRRLVIYPAILRHVHRQWTARMAGSG